MANELISRIDITIALDAKEIVTPSDIFTEYLPHVLPRAADKFSAQGVIDLIYAEQNSIEQQLGVKFHPQIITETVDLERVRESERTIIATKYPVNVPLSFSYEINGDAIFTYNDEWLTHYNDRRDYGTAFGREVYIIPYFIRERNSNSGILPEGNAYTYLYIEPFSGRGVPLGRSVQFITGYRYIPDEFRNYVKKRVAVHLLHQIGEMVKQAGLSSRTITYDGVNASEGYEGWWRSTFHDTIAEWKKELDQMYRELKTRYQNFSVGIA